MGALALDADVVIGLLDAGDAHHRRAVTFFDTIGDARLLMAMSAYAEILVGLVAQRREDLADQVVERARIELVPLDRTIARRAAGLRADNRSLRLPDALGLATALEREAQLITFDKRLHHIAERLS